MLGVGLELSRVFFDSDSRDCSSCCCSRNFCCSCSYSELVMRREERMGTMAVCTPRYRGSIKTRKEGSKIPVHIGVESVLVYEFVLFL